MGDYPYRQGPEETQGPLGGLEGLERQTEKAAHQAQRGARRAGGSLTQALDRGRMYAAAGLSKAAESLRSSTNGGDTSAKRFAENLEQGASYLRRTDLEGMRRDLVGIIERYPAQTLGAAFVVGLIVGSRLQRR